MNWVDIAILVVWGVTILWGYSTGLMGVLVPLISLVVGIALSSRIGDSVGEMFSSVTDNENAQAVAGFVLVFGVLFVAGGILNFMARKVLGVIPLFGFVNSLAGMAVGLLIGFILLSGMLTALQKYPVKDLEVDIDESKLGTLLADNFDVIIRGVGVIPGDWDNELEKLTE
ncbi:MAG: CvpA family protein [Chloroflexi bacterium]|nr:CvpA family protein [Chloroflexota bacterium]